MSDRNKGDEPIVRLDAEMKALIPDFLKHRAENAQTILDAVDAGDYEALRSLGHAIEGTGGAFGFIGIAHIGHSLRQAAIDEDRDQAQRLAGELASYVRRVKIVYV